MATNINMYKTVGKPIGKRPSGGCLVGMLLVSRSGLVEDDAIEVFHYHGFRLSSSFLMYNFKSFQGE